MLDHREQYLSYRNVLTYSKEKKHLKVFYFQYEFRPIFSSTASVKAKQEIIFFFVKLKKKKR